MPARGRPEFQHTPPDRTSIQTPRRRRLALDAMGQDGSNAGETRRLTEERLKRLTKEQLVRIARREALPHRSKMNKAQLARTLRKHFQMAK